MFLNLISNIKTYPFEDNLLIALLSFMSKVLEGGNLKVQKTIYNYFNHYPISEVLFNKFNNILLEFIEDLKETYKKEE